ncbi:MAG: hypothetical protein J6U15_04910, partial [Lachnospiraceae bacterium]|nr:hypothetical protein [Lachnospiraceae bacterium]
LLKYKGENKMVKLINKGRDETINEYAGTSLDTKPTDGVGVNDLFLELDTGDVYYFDGSDWQKVGG